MSKTLRVVFLSVLIAVLAVSSAFADIEADGSITIQEDTEKSLADNLLKGVTYTKRIYIDGDSNLTVGNNTYELSECDIDWVVSEDNDNDISWLQIYTASDDQALVMEGKIPSNDIQSYSLTVTAILSHRVGKLRYYYSEEGNYDIDIGDEAEGAEYFTPDESYNADNFNTYFSFDAGIVEDPLQVSEGYEVHLIIPEENDVLVAYLPEELELGSNIYMPLWLSFDVEETITTEDGTYPADIKFFYVSPDYAMSEDVTFSVYINGIKLWDDEEMTLGDTENVITWDFVYSVPEEDTSIVLSSDEISFDVDFDGTGSASTRYAGSAPVSWTIDTDSTSTIASADLGLAITSDDSKITITAAPSSAGYYNGVITFTASDSSTAELAFTVNVSTLLTISEDSLKVAAQVGYSNTGSLNFSGSSSAIVSYDADETVPESLGLEISSGDSTITFKITPSLSLDYTGTFTFYAADGASADVDITLQGLSVDQNAPRPEFAISEPAANRRTIELQPGRSRNIDIVTINGTGDITWGTPAVTPNVGLAATLADDTGERTLITIEASATASNGTVTITATDSTGKTVSITLIITVAQPEDNNNGSNDNNSGDNNNNNNNTNPGENNNNNSGNNQGDNNTDNNNNGNNSNNSSSGTVANPAIDSSVTETAFANNVAGALGTYTTAYIAAPATVRSNTNRDVSGVPSGYSDSSVTVLDVMHPNETAIYVFSVSKALDGVPGGALLNVFMNEVYFSNASVGTGSTRVSAAASYSAVLVDSKGNRITTMPEDGIVNMAAYMQEGKYYASAITHQLEGTGPGKPKGGCSVTGFGAMALMLAGSLLLRKRG